MSILASELIARIVVQGAREAERDLQGVGSASQRSSMIMSGLAIGAVGLGVGLVALGVKAVNMAGDFQQSMTQLVTGAGESRKNIGMVSQAILQMAVDTGTSTDQLAKGMYMIESAGFHGAAGLDILKAAAEGAKVGNADLGVVADGVTTIMTDYAKSGVTAAQATNDLVATVASGKTHMQDLAKAMASVLPTASAVHVSLADVSGAMATMTGEGVPAANAATYLRQMLLALEVPGKGAVKTLKDIGLTSSQVTDEMQKSLPGALQLITDHLAHVYGKDTPAYVAAMKDIAGGQKNFQAWLDLTNTHLPVFAQNVHNIADATEKGGKSIAGWNLVQGDFNQKWDVFTASLQVAGINLGTKLLPVAGQFLGVLAPISGAVSTLIGSSAGLPALGAAFAGIGTILLITAIPAMVSFAIAAGPILLAAAAIGLAAAGVILAFQHWGDIMDWLTGKSEIDAQRMQAANTMAAIGVDNQAMQQGLQRTRDLLQQKYGLEIQMQKTHDQYMKDLYKHMIDDINGQLDQGKNQQIQKEKDRNAKVLALHQTLAGQILLIEQRIASDIRDINITKPWVDQLTAQRTAILNELMHTHDKAKRSELQHQLDMIDVKIAAGQTELKNERADLAKAQALLDQANKKQLESEQNFLQRFATAIGNANNEFGTEWHNIFHNIVTIAENGLSEFGTLIRRSLNIAGQSFSSFGAQVHGVVWSIAADVQNAFSWIGQQISNLNSRMGGLGSFVGFPGHASGIVDSPTAHVAVVGERGPELMYVPKGASILPMNGSGGGGGGNIGMGGNQTVYLQVDGRTFARLILPHIVGNIRTATGVRV